MDKIYNEIKTPHLNANEDELKIVEINYKNYDYVKKNDNICSVESSKITQELITEYEGYIKYFCSKDTFIVTNQVIAVICQDLEKLKSLKTISNKNTEIQITKKAQKLIDKYSINKEKFENFKSIVTEKDVLKLIDKSIKLEDSNTKNIKISSIQKEIAKNVKLSQIENATTYMTVDLKKTEIIKLCKEKSSNLNLQINIVDLIMFNISKTINDYLLINSFLEDEKIIENKIINLGFTVEKNNNLFMPIIKNINKKKPKEIFVNKLDLIRKVFKNEINIKDLSDGTISVATISSGYIKHHYPIIYPKQSAIIGIGSLDLPISKIISDDHIGITIAYDHRIINGNYASEFIAKLIHNIENF